MRAVCRFGNPLPALALLMMLLEAGASCGTAPTSPTSQDTSTRVRTGPWGGNHIGLEVGEAGARVEYDCAHGNIDQPLALDRDGRFDVQGTYVRERGGPQPVEEQPGRPARYHGRVDGESMALTVTLADTNEALGAFTLTYGAHGFVRKCL